MRVGFVQRNPTIGDFDSNVASLVELGYDGVLVDRVLRMIRVNEYKPNQAAPGINISSKAFGRGRRVPLAARWSG